MNYKNSHRVTNKQRISRLLCSLSRGVTWSSANFLIAIRACLWVEALKKKDHPGPRLLGTAEKPKNLRSLNTDVTQRGLFSISPSLCFVSPLRLFRPRRAPPVHLHPPALHQHSQSHLASIHCSEHSELFWLFWWSPVLGFGDLDIMVLFSCLVGWSESSPCLCTCLPCLFLGCIGDCVYTLFP